MKGLGIEVVVVFGVVIFVGMLFAAWKGARV